MLENALNKTLIERKECPICFIDRSDQPKFLSSCGCETCNPCLVQWILSKLEDCNGNENFPIPCMSLNCKKTFKVKEVLFYLPQEDQTRVNDLLLKRYLSQTKDICKCPNPKCSNAGVIDPKHCKENLNCDTCGTSWKDLQQYSKTERIFKQIQRVLTQKDEFLSCIVKSLITKQCPQCEVRIEKDVGCDHMTCTACGYQFCWICLEVDPFHDSSLHRSHIYKQILLSLLALFVSIFIFYVLYLLPPFNFICSWTVVPVLLFIKSLAAWILANIMKLVLLNVMVICLDSIVDSRVLSRFKYYFLAALLLSGFITYYFDVTQTVMTIGLVELAVFVGYKIGLCISCLITQKRFPRAKFWIEKFAAP